jgi:hypothetical protein
VTSIAIPLPTNAEDDGIIEMSMGCTHGSTITRVWCNTDKGTATINFEERVVTTPNTSGVDVLNAGLVCDTNSQSSCSSGCSVNTISNATIDQRDPVTLMVDSVATAPNVVRIHVEYTCDAS